LRDLRWTVAEHILRHVAMYGAHFAARSVVRLHIAAVLSLLAIGCDVHLAKTIDAFPTPNEKASSFPPPPAVSVITGLLGPESALHDAKRDVYYISNMNGGLLDVDGNGFISRIDAKTMKVDLRWIESGKNGVRLDAPKGLAVLGDSLYVGDVTAVRRFDVRNGAPNGDITLDGATLINDLTTDGRSIYVSDSGIRPASGIEFAATGTDAIWKIDGERAVKIAEGAELGHPNGLDFANGSLWVVTFGGNELYRLEGNRKASIQKLASGQLDGLVHLRDGSRLVSSWMGRAIYRSDERNASRALLTGITTPADIGYDAERQRLLVPRSASNQVTIHQLPTR
jgi:hypothetical protein